jgi:ATP-binding cassette subfamily C protein
MLGLGAWLAIKGEISAGTIIAASILSSRALAPVDQAIASWKGFIAARQGYARLSKLLAGLATAAPDVQLPAPCRSLAAEALFLGAPGMNKPLIRNINFKLEAGQALGIIGASASGKSTLGRALGIWAARKQVMLDGANIAHWDPARLGPHTGYLPQDIQLFDGTVAENIARFRKPIDSEAVLKAARAAGFHEHILALPNGYETRIGRGEMELSAGQKQRLGLARALYGDPFLVILDEPNSNLDAEGEAALSAAIAGIAERGGIAIVIAHRPSAIAAVTQLAVMQAGEIVAMGPRDEILARTVKNAHEVRRGPAGLRVMQGTGGYQ